MRRIIIAGDQVITQESVVKRGGGREQVNGWWINIPACNLLPAARPLAVGYKNLQEIN